MKKLILAAVLLAAAGSSCKKKDCVIADEARLLKGPEVNVLEGKAWTWVESKGERPLRVGITLTEKAVPGPNVFSTLHEGHGEVIAYQLDLPENKTTALFDHVTIDWNPEGHAPQFIYDQPHFDFHFYFDTKSDIAKIPAYETDSTGFKNYPASTYLPTDYIPTLPGVERMGVHWVDRSAPEFHGEFFTQTFIYGTYNGYVNFYEPMATNSFLKDLRFNKTYRRGIPQPQKVSRTGYYPTVITYNKVDVGYEVVLEDFVYRQKS